MIFLLEFKKTIRYIWIVAVLALVFVAGNCSLVIDHQGRYLDEIHKEISLVEKSGSAEIDDDFIGLYYNEVVLPTLKNACKSADTSIGDISDEISPGLDSSDFESLFEGVKTFIASDKYNGISESKKMLIREIANELESFNTSIVSQRGAFYFIENGKTHFSDSIFLVIRMISVEALVILLLLFILFNRCEKQSDGNMADFCDSTSRGKKLYSYKLGVIAAAGAVMTMFMALATFSFHCLYIGYKPFLSVKVNNSFFAAGFEGYFRVSLTGFFAVSLLSILLGLSVPALTAAVVMKKTRSSVPWIALSLIISGLPIIVKEYIPVTILLLQAPHALLAGAETTLTIIPVKIQLAISAVYSGLICVFEVSLFKFFNKRYGKEK